MTIWVKSNSTGISSSVDTTIYLYYGNSDALDISNATDVWDSNYRSVWHLESTSDLLDSTTNDNDGTNNGASNDSSGQIGGALAFTGTSNDVDINNVADDIDTAEGTFSAWIKMDTSILTDNVNRGIVEVGDVSSLDDFIGFRMLAGDFMFRYRVGATNYQSTVSDLSGYDDWKHIVGVSVIEFARTSVALSPSVRTSVCVIGGNDSLLVTA